MTSDYKLQAYLMENQEEGQRLELKTDREAVKRQAAWAGIGSGMSDSITTAALAELVGSNGNVTGLSFQKTGWPRLANACNKPCWMLWLAWKKTLTSILMPVAAYGGDFKAFRDESQNLCTIQCVSHIHR